MDRGNAEEACPKLAESQRLDPQLGTLLHLADCYARIGRTASAWADFKDAREIAASRGDPREAKIRDRLTELEQRLPRLRIDVREPSPAGLEVRADGNSIGRALWGTQMPIDPGVHSLTASADGREPWKTSVSVGADGSVVDVAIPVLAVAHAAPRGATPLAPPDHRRDTLPSSSGQTQRLLGWIATGVGAVGIGVGVAFEIVLANKVSERDALCSNTPCTRADADRVAVLNGEVQTAQTVGAAGLVAGGVFAAGGLVLVFTSKSNGDSPSLAATPIVAPGFAGGAVRWRL